MTTPIDTAAAEKEVHANYQFFKKMQPEWEKEHLSHHVLIHRQNLVEFFEDEDDAIRTGIREYGMGNFSVQSVRDEFIDFGYQTHVLF